MNATPTTDSEAENILSRSESVTSNFAVPVNNENACSDLLPTEIGPEPKSSPIEPMSTISKSSENISCVLQKNDIRDISYLDDSPPNNSEFHEATCVSVEPI